MAVRCAILVTLLRARHDIPQASLRHVSVRPANPSAAGHDCVGATLIIAKFNERSLVVKSLNDRADLPARKPMRAMPLRRIGMTFRSLRLFSPASRHSTVTNLGAPRLVRTIQIVLTAAVFACRRIVASRRRWVPQAPFATRKASPACCFRAEDRAATCVAALKITDLAEHPGLVLRLPTKTRLPGR